MIGNIWSHWTEADKRFVVDRLFLSQHSSKPMLAALACH